MEVFFLKLYKLYIKANDDVKTDVLVEAKSIEDLINMLRLDDQFLNFRSNKFPDSKSFTLFKNDIRRIDFEVVNSLKLTVTDVYTII